jgi:RNA polymerase sigma factor (sigma-70 family)
MEARPWTLGSVPAPAPAVIEKAASPRVPDAFEDLFRAEYGRVVAIAHRVLLRRDEAEEVAQDVFLQFHQRHDPAAGYAPAWLYRAASHAALNRLRGNRRRVARETANHDDPPVDPAVAVEAAERRQMVRDAMGRLPRKSATVLALRYGGLSYAETAAALGVGIGQVGTLLRRAEARLKKELSHDPR